MSAHVDTRMADRRRQVREAWARRRLRWVVAGAGLVLVGAIAYAVLDSPWLAVREIEVEGAQRAPVDALLAEAGIVPGTPTIRVRPDAVVATLEADPWVADAEVAVDWPGTVEVVVEERVPAAWVDTGAGWVAVAVDGVVLTTGRPPPGAPRLDSVLAELSPGDRVHGAGPAAVIGFLGRLPGDLAKGATGAATTRGGTVALGGFTVLFGDGTELDAKVASLVALLERGLRPGSTITVVSPTRPAVAGPPG